MKRLGFFIILLYSFPTFSQNDSSFSDFLKQSQVDGNLRLYKFTRNFGNPLLPPQNSFSVGGRLNLVTAPVYGFKGGLSYYAADTLGLNSTTISHVDRSLPGRSVNVLGQTFLAFENKKMRFRGGNQLMNTPFINESDSRMIPATYQGLYVEFIPFKELKFTAVAINRYKSRTAKEFNQTNLYTPGNYGGTPIDEMQKIRIKGAFASGLNHEITLNAHHNLKTQGWYYKFYDFANLLYADTIYYYQNETKIEPFLGAQLGSETGDGKNYLQGFGYGSTRSTFYGIIAGAHALNGLLALGYNDMPMRHGAYRNGDIVSPYTSGYVSEPLYSSSMMGGLIEKAAGSAIRLSGYVLFFEHSLKLYSSFAKYFTHPYFPNTTEMDFEIQYKFTHTALKNLNIRNRLGVLNGNPATGRSLYNRIMLQYDF